MEKRKGPCGAPWDPGLPAALRRDVQPVSRPMGEGGHVSAVRAGGNTVNGAFSDQLSAISFQLSAFSSQPGRQQVGVETGSEGGPLLLAES